MRILVSVESKIISMSLGLNIEDKNHDKNWIKVLKHKNWKFAKQQKRSWYNQPQYWNKVLNCKNC